MPKITVTKPIYRAQRATINKKKKECVTKQAEIEYNDRLQLLACNFDRKGPNPFKYMDGLIVWIIDPADVRHTHDEYEDVDEEE